MGKRKSTDGPSAKNAKASKADAKLLAEVHKVTAWLLAGETIA